MHKSSSSNASTDKNSLDASSPNNARPAYRVATNDLYRYLRWTAELGIEPVQQHQHETEKNALFYIDIPAHEVNKLEL